MNRAILTVPYEPPVFQPQGQNPGIWLSVSPNATGAPPEGREWAWIVTSGALEFALSPDSGVTTDLVLGEVTGAYGTRVPVPPGWGLFARHPGDGSDDRYALIAWGDE